MTIEIPDDTIGAFVGAPSLLVHGAADGPLAGESLAVKDLFDVAGTVTGAGNPTFAAGREPAAASATAVQRLVDAGASVVGKTITDELAYSLAGTNVHFGTPTNVAAPGRTPGGSSVGSAAAVAAGLVDLALGTDTGGSIRVPASYCGIYGWRPTHGAVSAAGVVPLAPSFDTMGLLSRDPGLLARGASVLLGGASIVLDAPVRVVVPTELLSCVAGRLADQLMATVESLGVGATAIDLGVDLDAAVGAFRRLQGAEAWATHGAWITEHQPSFGPGITARFEAASQVTPEQVSAAAVVREQVTTAVRDATADGTVLVMPAAAGAAPLLDGSDGDAEERRLATLRLTCIAGLAGAPVVVAPWATDDGLPFGLAFVGAPGTDLRLLDWVADHS
jgi:amidase